MKRTHDKDDGTARASFLTVEKLGEKRELTQSGSLICYDVAIARAGWMIYEPEKLPMISPSKEHPEYLRIYRTEQELFRPETMASFAGVAVTDDHPGEDDDGQVTPDNWGSLAKGFALHNIRRGVGENADCLVADLVITDADTIKAVNSGLREVSCGYDADYTEDSPGIGQQSNIIGNHIALVEKGRCGPRCAISDHAPTTMKGNTMGTRTKTPLAPKLAALRRKFVADADNLLEEANELPDDNSDDLGTDPTQGKGVQIHIHTAQGGGASAVPKPGEGADSLDPAAGAAPGGDPAGADPMEQRIAALEQGHQQITASIQQLTEAIHGLTGQQGAPAGDEADPDAPKDPDEEGNPFADESDPDAEAEAKKKETMMTADSAALATAFAKVVADAEVLVPGFRVPTFDSKAKRKTTVDGLCAMRRRVLDTCYSTREGQQLVDSVHGKAPNLSQMDCASVATLFRASAGAKRLLNNRTATADAGKMAEPKTDGVKKPMSIADMNKANAAFWAAQGIPQQ